MELLAGPAQVDGHLFSGFSFTFESLDPDRVNELTHSITKHGGDVSGMLTFATTHLLVAAGAEPGFQERKAMKRDVWVVGDDFVDSSVRAGMALPEFQFTVKRTVQELLKEAEREEVDEMEVVASSSTGERLIVELEARLERDGGQPWGMGMEWRSSGQQFEKSVSGVINDTAEEQKADVQEESIRYLLGTYVPREAPTGAGSNAVMPNRQEKRNTVMERKKKRRNGGGKSKKAKNPKKQPKKQPKKPSTIRSVADKALATSPDSSANAINDVVKYVSVVSLSGETNEEKECSEGELFVDVDCGVQHVVLVSQQGQVWERTATRLPRMVHGLPSKVAAVACGRAHSLILTVSGDVYSWGSNFKGQLGLGHYVDTDSPQQVRGHLAAVPIKAVRAGGNFSAAISCTGGVFSWGCNTSGQLGRGSLCPALPLPGMVQFPAEFSGSIFDVQCGWSHAIAQCVDGVTLLSWGSNRFGQCGRAANDVHLHQLLPARVCGLESIVGKSYQGRLSLEVTEVACGRYHSAALLSDGSLVTWGQGLAGQLGHPCSSSESTSQPLPKVVEYFVDQDLSLSQVRCGDFHTAVTVQETGALYLIGTAAIAAVTAGDSQEGDVACTKGDEFLPFRVPDMFCDSIACGGNTTVVLLNDWSALLQRHCIEGNLELLEKILKHLEENRDLLAEQLDHHLVEEHSVHRNDSSGALMQIFLRRIAVDESGNTLLHLAALHRRHELMESLLVRYGGYGYLDASQATFDLNQGNTEGETVLHVCARTNSSSCLRLVLSFAAKSLLSRREVKAVLDEACTFPDAAFYAAEKEEEPFSYWFSMARHREQVQPSLATRRDRSSRTNRSALIMETWKKKLDIDRLDKSGHTPLALAVAYKSFRCVELLTQAGADKSIGVTGSMATPLHLAIQGESIMTASYLVSHAASITEVDKFNLTPLDYCDWGDRSNLKRIAVVNDCFISYAHADHSFALKLRKEMGKHGLRCWMDDWRLEVGGDWRDAIGEGLTECKIVIFIASEASVVSKWCLKELHLAKKKRKIIVPVVQEHSILSKEAEFDTLLRQVLYAPSESISRAVDVSIFSRDEERFRLISCALSIRIRNKLEHIMQHGLTCAHSSKAPEKSQALAALMEEPVCVNATNAEDGEELVSWLLSHVKERALAADNRIRQSSRSELDMYVMRNSGEVDESLATCWCYTLFVTRAELSSRLLHDLRTVTAKKIPVILLLCDGERKRYTNLSATALLEEFLSVVKRATNAEEGVEEYLRGQFFFRERDHRWTDQVLHTLSLFRSRSLFTRRRRMLEERIEGHRKKEALRNGSLR